MYVELKALPGLKMEWVKWLSWGSDNIREQAMNFMPSPGHWKHQANFSQQNCVLLAHPSALHIFAPSVTHSTHHRRKKTLAQLLFSSGTSDFCWPLAPMPQQKPAELPIWLPSRTVWHDDQLMPVWYLQPFLFPHVSVWSFWSSVCLLPSHQSLWCRQNYPKVFRFVPKQNCHIHWVVSAAVALKITAKNTSNLSRDNFCCSSQPLKRLESSLAYSDSASCFVPSNLPWTYAS